MEQVANDVMIQDSQPTIIDSSAVSEAPAQIVPGPRASKLQKIYAAATNHVLQTCSYKSFASCFPTPARVKPDVLKDLHRQFTSDLGRQMQLNFDVILEDNDVIPRLNELDRLILEAKKRRAEAGQDPTSPRVVP